MAFTEQYTEILDPRPSGSNQFPYSRYETDVGSNIQNIKRAVDRTLVVSGAGTITQYMAVVPNASTAGSVDATSSAGQAGPVWVAQAGGISTASIRVRYAGFTRLLVTGTVALLDRLQASATAGRAQAGTTNAFAIALSTNPSGTGEIEALLLPPGAGSGSAPADAQYWTSRSESGLSAEINLGALTTGIVKVTVAGGTATPSTAGGADLPVMTASGGGHHGGAVPDPPASSGTTKFLREDATWAVPTAGGTIAISGGTVTDYIDWADQGSDGGTPSSGYHRLYAKAGGLYVRDSGGTVVGALGAGGGGGDSTTQAAFSSRPSTGNDGNLFLPTNGFTIDRDDGSNWDPYGPAFAFTPMVNGDYAWINQTGGGGSATVTADKNAVYFFVPKQSGDQWRIRKKAKSAPYTVTCAFLPTMLNVSAHQLGIGWRQSSDGKFIFFGICAAAGSTDPTWRVQKWNSVTSFSAEPTTVAAIVGGSGLVWLKIEDDNTNRKAYVSGDGQNWIQLYSETRTTFLTADEVGLFALNDNTTYDAGYTVLHWAET